MYAGVGQPVPIPTIAAHNPQQGLVPVGPKVKPGARGTRYQPNAPVTTLPGESPYAARLRNAAAYQQKLARQKKQALAGMAGFAQDDANAFAMMVKSAEAGAAATSQQQAAFTAAGAPVDETYAINKLVQAHRDEIAANVQAAADANAAGNMVPVLAAGGQVVMVDASTDPAVAAALAARRAANPVAIPAGNPLAAAAMAVTPDQAAAAAIFGQSAPDPQTAILAKVQAKAAKAQAGMGNLRRVRRRGMAGLGQAAPVAAAPAIAPWIVYAVVGAGLYWLVKEH